MPTWAKVRFGLAIVALSIAGLALNRSTHDHWAAVVRIAQLVTVWIVAGWSLLTLIRQRRIDRITVRSQRR
jgi:hypothetical protein